MKVGTDGVLLGAWVELRPDDRRMLDIGTGTGLIALMLAQRTADRPLTEAVQITGVDMVAVEEARENADRSKWGDRIHFEQVAVQHYEGGPFDLIVSNPPFFVESLLSPDAGRTTARHAVELPFEELRDAVLRLLKPTGRFALVLPISEAARFIALCEGRLWVSRRTEVRTTPRHPAKRVLLCLEPTSASGTCRSDELMIGTGEHEVYTEAYRALTRDFYLKF